MKAITSARQGGKTTQMIAALRAHPEAVMVVSSERMRQQLIGQHPDLKGRLHTFEDFGRTSRGFVRPETPVYIDDADTFLRHFFGNVQILSFSEEE